MNETYKNKALSGLLWKYGERMLAQIVSLVVSIILARLLEPEHYGVIALVHIFITICNVFVVTGLGESLIQKKDADQLDFCSIFFLNIAVSVFLYGILFFCAPAISRFYDNKYPELTALIRVMGIRLVFAAINSVQSAKVSREMCFQKYFWVTLIGTAVSAVVGIGMAYYGFGVWALAAQYMTNSIIDTIMLFVFVNWYPTLCFSWERVKPLFRYGWKVLAASLAGTLYSEMRSLIIGKRYSSTDLAYYSKGGTYPGLIANNLNSAIASVAFPVFARIQDDENELKRILAKAMTTSSYLIFPAMFGLAVVAPTFIELLLTNKWMPCVPYLQMMCIVFALKPVFGFNLQCMTARGNSGRYLKLVTAEYAIGLFLLLVSFKYGVFWIAVSQVASTILNSILDAVVGGGEISYGLILQIKDISLNLIITLVMVGCVLAFRIIVSIDSLLLSLLCQVCVGALVYVVLSIVSKNQSYGFVRNYLRRLLNGNK